MSEDYTRADAKLKRLPIAVICEIVARCQSPGVTQSDVVAWLKAEHGVSSSVGALSVHYTYLVQRVKAWEREQKIQAWQDCEKLEHPELSDAELFRRAQRKFSLITIAEEDPKGWALIQKTARDQEAGLLDKIKFQRETCELFVKWSADKAAQEVLRANSSNSEKIERLGELMFGEDWK